MNYSEIDQIIIFSCPLKRHVEFGSLEEKQKTANTPNVRILTRMIFG